VANSVAPPISTCHTLQFHINAVPVNCSMWTVQIFTRCSEPQF